MLPLILLAALTPDSSRLGVDDWREREAATARYSNPLSALMLPDTHEDAEVSHRIKGIKARTLRDLDPRYIEAKMHRDDFTVWLQRYVIDGDSLAYTLAEVFHELHTDNGKADEFFRLAPIIGYDNGTWLRGGFVEGEYQKWRERVLLYRTLHAAEAIINGVSNDSSHKPAPIPTGAKPVEKNPYGPNRKARRAQASDDRRETRVITKMIKRLSS